MDLKVEYLPHLKKYCIKEKIQGQIYYMEFSEEYSTFDTIYYNIALCVTSKRKQVINFENEVQETRKNPFATYAFCKQAYQLLEQEVLQYYKDFNRVFIVRWLDNRRRDAYYHFLKKYGFNFGFIDNKKCLCKRVGVQICQ